MKPRKYSGRAGGELGLCKTRIKQLKRMRRRDPTIIKRFGFDLAPLNQLETEGFIIARDEPGDVVHLGALLAIYEMEQAGKLVAVPSGMPAPWVKWIFKVTEREFTHEQVGYDS